MTKKEAIKLFEERKVRTVWDDELEKWYFSIVDVIGVLTDSPDPRNYWKVLKNRLKITKVRVLGDEHVGPDTYASLKRGWI